MRGEAPIVNGLHLSLEADLRAIWRLWLGPISDRRLAEHIAFGCCALFVTATGLTSAYIFWSAGLFMGHSNFQLAVIPRLSVEAAVVFAAPAWLAFRRSAVAAWIVLVLSAIITLAVSVMAFLALRILWYDLAVPPKGVLRTLGLIQSVYIPLAIIWLVEFALSWRAVKATSALHRLALEGLRSGAASAFD